MLRKLFASLTVILAFIFLFILKDSFTQSTKISEKENLVVVSLAKDTPVLNIIFLKEKSDKNLTKNKYEFLFFNDFLEVITELANNKTDIAFIPSNLAAILHNKTNSIVKVVSISSLENFYIVGNNIFIKNIEDLKGKCVYVLKKNIYIKPIIEIIFKKHNLSLESDLKIEVLKDDKSSILDDLDSGKIETIVLNELDYLNLIALKKEDEHTLRYSKVINLNKEWLNLTNSTLPFTCLVARKEFIEKRKDIFRMFLKDYGENFTSAYKNLTNTANLTNNILNIEEEVIKKSIPSCNLVNITGEEMFNLMGNFFKEIFLLRKEDIGGKFPGTDFYYQIS